MINIEVIILDQNHNKEIAETIRLSSDKQICIIPQASNSVELKLVGGHCVLNSVKLEGRD